MRKAPKSFPCSIHIGGEDFFIASMLHYVYLNEMADKLYGTIYGYIAQPDFDYYCSTHPQETNCFATAVVMDAWVNEQPFNEE